MADEWSCDQHDERHEMVHTLETFNRQHTSNGHFLIVNLQKDGMDS